MDKVLLVPAKSDPERDSVAQAWTAQPDGAEPSCISKTGEVTFHREVGQMINGIITNKLTNLAEVLGELRSLGPISAERLESDWIVRRAVERDLQIAVETVLDVCHRIISLSKSPPASSSRQSVEFCVQLGALSSAQLYAPMIGFRNLLVHQYSDVRVEILADIVNSKLGVLDQFSQEVLDYASRT